MILNWRPVDAGGGFLINTSLTTAESEQLSALARGDVLEIGAAYGYSTVIMARSASVVVSIDPHEALDSFGAWDYNVSRSPGVKAIVCPILGWSQDVLPKIADRSFDLVFVDGDHGFSACLHDLGHAARIVRPGGVVAVHDYGEDTCPDVRRAIQAWRGFSSFTLTDTLAVFRA